MSVMLSAASCLDWAARLTGTATVAELIALAENAPVSDAGMVLPYLSGERTPHNNPAAKGVLFGLTHQHGPADIARAVLEGVGFATAEGMDVLHATGLMPHSITLIGGGARALTGGKCWQISVVTRWSIVLAVMLAQRWARRVWHKSPCIPEPLEPFLPALPLEKVHQPDAEKHADYCARRETFKALYDKLSPLM